MQVCALKHTCHLALRHAVGVYTHMYIHICTYPIVRIFVMAVDSCACSRGALKRALISGTCGVRLSGVRQDGKKRRGGDKGEWQRSRCVIKAFKSAQDRLTCSNDMCWCCCCAASVQKLTLGPAPHSFHARGHKTKWEMLLQKTVNNFRHSDALY